MFSNHFLLFILFGAVLIHATEIELNFEKEHHPLIIEWRRNKPYAVPSWKDDQSMIHFHATKEDSDICLTCPPQTEEEIRISNEQAKRILSESFLFINTGSDKYCKKPLVPSVVTTDTECGGIGKKGKIYNFGYWKPKFVKLYEICYLKRVIFTKHKLYPKQGLLNHKISQDELEMKELEIATNGEIQIRPQEIPSPRSNIKDNEMLHQFVPYNDMLPIPWRTSTLFDINVINVKEDLKSYLEDINDWIRGSAFDAPNPLHIFSGASPTSPSSEWKWFWKILLMNVPKNDENDEVETKGIAIGTSDEIKDCNRPCQYDEKIFKEVGLEELHENVPCLFACKIERSLVEKFELTTQKKDSDVEYMEDAELLNFKSILTGQKRNSRSEFTENPELQNSVSLSESNKKPKIQPSPTTEGIAF